MMTAFWDIAPCNLVEVKDCIQNFGGNICWKIVSWKANIKMDLKEMGNKDGM
jgi:hypothetical protein